MIDLRVTEYDPDDEDYADAESMHLEANEATETEQSLENVIADAEHLGRQLAKLQRQLGIVQAERAAAAKASGATRVEAAVQESAQPRRATDEEAQAALTSKV